MLTLAITLAAALPQDESEPEPAFLVGGMQHVQLVSAPGPGTTGRLATSYGLGPADGGGPLPGGRIGLHDATTGELLATMPLPVSFVPPSGTENPPEWRLFRLARTTLVIIRLHETDELQVLRFPDGEILHREEDVTAFHDARLSPWSGKIEVLVGHDDAIERLRFDRTGARQERVTASRGIDHALAAAFVTGAPSKYEAVVFGTRETSMSGTIEVLTLVPDDLEGIHWREMPSGVRLTPPVREGPVRPRSYRLSAASGPSGPCVAVATHEWIGPQCVTVVEVPRNGVTRELWSAEQSGAVGETPPHATLGPENFGQWIGFVRDADGDGVPELLTTSPGRVLDGGYDLNSGATGVVLDREPAPSVGYATMASVGPAGTFALMGSAPLGGYEAHQRIGAVELLHIVGLPHPRMVRVRSFLGDPVPLRTE